MCLQSSNIKQGCKKDTNMYLILIVQVKGQTMLIKDPTKLNDS